MKIKAKAFFHYLLKELNYYGIETIGFTISRKVAFMELKVEN